MEWINIIVAAVCSLIGALGGGSILYFKLNKQLKQTEVVHNQADYLQVTLTKKDNYTNKI